MKSLVFLASAVGTLAQISASIIPPTFSVVVASSTVPPILYASIVIPTSVPASAVSSVPAASPSSSATYPACPANNGQIFPINGYIFNIVCGAGAVTRRSLPEPIPVAKRQIFGLNSFGLCISSCAATAGCQSVLFNRATGACAVYNCVVPVPAGLAGAVVVSGPNGAITTTACPAAIPQNVPVVNNTIVLNLNLNVTVDVVVNAFDYNGLPVTSVCHGKKCGTSKGDDGYCPNAKPIPKEKCCICYQPDKQAPPMKPTSAPVCEKCEQAKNYPTGAAKPSGSYGYDDSYKPSNATGGKYAGPYSSDAVTQSASFVALAGAALMALMM